MKKKLVSVLLAALMVATCFSGCGKEKEFDLNELKTLTIMVDGTLNLSEETGLNEFEAAWESKIKAKTGADIDLVIIKPDHSDYADALARQLATSDKPDVVLMSAQIYAQYAAFDGVLWDMTKAYENADFQARNTRKNVNEGNYVNGKLYGLSPAAGNGCVTYVKKTWLDNVGLKVEDIKTWNDYYNMLLKFTKEDPDGNGKKGDTYGVIAAGLISAEAPWTNYMPEFWQNAYPSFVQDANGTWIDGFQSAETKAALERLRQGWVDGVIDPDTSAFYGQTKKAREKWFSADQTGSAGAFAYWAGTWCQTLKTNLSKNGVNDDIVQLNLLEEMNGFLDRKAPVWVILADENDKDNSREQAIFDIFFETMLDGDEFQTMWEYGVEDVHWSVKAEEFVTNPGTDKETKYSYKDGEFHMRPSMTDANTLYAKNHIDNLLAICPLTNGYATLEDVVSKSNEQFCMYAISAPNVPSSTTYSTSGSTVTDAALVAVTSIVKDGVPYETAMEKYKQSCGTLVDTILAELNAQ